MNFDFHNNKKIFKSNNPQAKITKSENVDSQDLDLINQFTLKKLEKNDVFTFTMTLCTNEIDRDCESFTADTIKQLAKMFIGKTCIFDHKANAKNQSARIFKTYVKTSNEETSFGEQKVLLKASAYIVKCSEFNDLIKKINGGILKEISISCKVKNKICSICGQDQFTMHGCANEHRFFEHYNNKICYKKLIKPLDAYECSFVPIPAQPTAQITKNFETIEKNEENFLYFEKIGIEQTKKLQKQVLKLGWLCGFDEPDETKTILEKVINKLSFNELEQIKKVFEQILNNSQLNKTLLNKKTKECAIDKTNFKNYVDLKNID